MTDTSPTLDLAGVSLLGRLDSLLEEIETHTFPRIIASAEREDPDDEDSDIDGVELKCPWCESTDEDFYSVDYDFRENSAMSFDADDYETSKIWFSAADQDYGPTLYYKHLTCGRPVSLPEGYTEDWS